MINHRLIRPGPAQRATSEISNTLSNLAAEVRELNGTLDDRRSWPESDLETARPESEPLPDQEPPTDFPRETPADARWVETVPASQPARPPEPATIKQNIAIEVKPEPAKPNREAPHRDAVGSPKVERALAGNTEVVEARVSRPLREAPASSPEVLPRRPVRTVSPAPLPFSAPAPQALELDRQMETFTATMIRNQETVLRSLQRVVAYCQQVESRYEGIIREMERMGARLRNSSDIP